MPDHTPLRIKVTGDLACFSRPELKVERVSYEVMTPSAARGILDAVYWKPEMTWRVRRITVLNPIRRTSSTRNEVNSVASERAVRSGMKSGDYAYYADEDRTQRHTVALRDVAYLIEADAIPHDGSHPAKHRDIFRRRVRRGQCFTRPYLGCREFAARFEEPDGTERAADELLGRTEPLGRMLFDLLYRADGPSTPLFFNAVLDDGVLHVPDGLYDQLRAPAEAAP